MSTTPNPAQAGARLALDFARILRAMDQNAIANALANELIARLASDPRLAPAQEQAHVDLRDLRPELFGLRSEQSGKARVPADGRRNSRRCRCVYAALDGRPAVISPGPASGRGAWVAEKRPTRICARHRRLPPRVVCPLPQADHAR